MSSPAGESGIHLHVAFHQVVISATGTVTEPSLASLQEAMKAALAQPSLPVVLDLRQATEIDDKALSWLHRTGQQFIRSRRGLTIRLTAGTQPARVLELSRMDELMIDLCGRDAPNFFVIVTDTSS